jgi:hypothetical protein
MVREFRTHLERGNACSIAVGKPEVKRPPGRPSHKWEDNIKIDCSEIGWSTMDWIHLTQNRHHWWTLMRTAMNLLAL